MNTESSHFKSKDFAIRAQKKILSQFSSRKTAKVFISENLSTLLDLLYQLVKTHVCMQNNVEKYIFNFNLTEFIFYS